MVNTAKNPMIQLHTYSEVREVSGSTGDFRVVIEEKARFVDPRKCTGCEACVSKCPTEVPSEFNKYVGTRKAIYVPFPQAVPKVALIDKNSCINCKLCSKTCQAGAIDYDQQPNIITTKVGAVIIATGWDEYNLLRHSEYGYGKYPNVITQAELERMLSPVGPTGGHVYRISDGKTPQKLAMIQCVGSRNVKTNPYCSGVCCMVAMKNAQILRQEYPDSEIAIFFIDVRATDKGNEEYFARIRDKDIKFIRGIIGEVREDPETQNLTIRAYSGSTDRIIKYDADLLVLSAGIEPSQGTYDIAKTMGLDKGPGGFLRETHGCLAPQETKTKGIYICGCAAGPKNIPYSVSSALAAAANAASLVTRGIFQQELLTPVVDVDLCMGCHRCEKVCPVGAIRVNSEGYAEIQEINCKGCGICVSSCPARALDLRYYRDTQVKAEIAGLLEGP